VVVVFGNLGGVGATLVLGTGQGQGSLPYAGTVHPLQRQADTYYQQVESEPGGEPPCEVAIEHGAKLRLPKQLFGIWELNVLLPK
jgi:hypothetical protein